MDCFAELTEAFEQLPAIVPAFLGSLGGLPGLLSRPWAALGGPCRVLASSWAGPGRPRAALGRPSRAPREALGGLGQALPGSGELLGRSWARWVGPGQVFWSFLAGLRRSLGGQRARRVEKYRFPTVFASFLAGLAGFWRAPGQVMGALEWPWAGLLELLGRLGALPGRLEGQKGRQVAFSTFFCRFSCGPGAFPGRPEGQRGRKVVFSRGFCWF